MRCLYTHNPTACGAPNRYGSSSLNRAQYHFLHTDHLGTPQLAVNQQQQVSWQAVSEAFGKTLPDADNQITMNLRLPGQYFDQESGAHYNFFRDYHPQIGRYIQSDPIGLMGGMNNYTYALNPIEQIDPLGLFIPLVIAGVYLSSEAVAVISTLTLTAAMLSTPAGKQAANLLNQSISNAINKTPTLAKCSPGNLDPSGPECNELNNKVQHAKDIVNKFGKGKGSCQEGMSVWQLAQRKNAWYDLAKARSIRDQKCWGGGD